MQHINRFLGMCIEEMRMMLKDEGVLMFIVFVPIFYPLLYSWIYDNERPNEVEIVVIDQAKSNLSRRLIRAIDASSDVKVACYANDLNEARDIVGRHDAYGVVLVPEDFDLKLGRMEQTSVMVYTDMSYMLAYKAVYQTLTAVTTEIGNDLKRTLSGAYTSRDEELSLAPIEIRDVPIFNPAGGYGSFILPPVLILIIQQTILLGMGITAGTYAERKRRGEFSALVGRNRQMFEFIPRGVCYFILYTVLAAYLVMAVPHFFSFLQLAEPKVLMWFMVPYTLSCICFASVVSFFVKKREEVMIMVVFTSVPFLMLSGVSWPQSNIPDFWRIVSYLFPSTFGIQGFMKLNSMGASTAMVKPEYVSLWVQMVVYFVIASVINLRYWRKK